MSLLAALSVPGGTIGFVPVATGSADILVSHTGVPLTRATTFKFTLDVLSSKTCSGCGEVKSDLTFADRVYECDRCGLVIDRDLNAAINLTRYTPPADTGTETSPPLTAAA